MSTIATPPKLKPTPVEAIKIIARLAAVFKNHQSQADAREQELVDLMGTRDFADAMEMKPELIDTLGADLMALKTQHEMAAIAAKSTMRRVRELAPLTLPEFFRISEELAVLHETCRALITKVTKDGFLCTAHGLLTPAELEFLVRHSPRLREQTQFEAEHPARVSVPLTSMVKDGVVTDNPHEDAFADIDVFGRCFDQLTSRLEAARARLASLRQQERDFEASQKNEAGALRREVAELRRKLAAAS